MISWGMVTILTAFVHTAGQFYAARFFLGAAESSFFPGMIAGAELVSIETNFLQVDELFHFAVTDA